MALNIFWREGHLTEKKLSGSGMWIRTVVDLEVKNVFPVERPTLIVPSPGGAVFVAGYYRDCHGQILMLLRELVLPRKKVPKSSRLDDFQTAVIHLPKDATSCVPLRYALTKSEVIFELEVKRETEKGYLLATEYLGVSLKAKTQRTRDVPSGEASDLEFKTTTSQTKLDNGIHLKWEVTGEAASTYEAQLLASRDGTEFKRVGSDFYSLEYGFLEAPLLERGPAGTVIIAGSRGPTNFESGGWIVGIELLSKNLKEFDNADYPPRGLDMYPRPPGQDESGSLNFAFQSKKGEVLLLGDGPVLKPIHEKDAPECEESYVVNLDLRKKSWIKRSLEKVEFKGSKYSVLESQLSGFTSQRGTFFTYGNFQDKKCRSFGGIFRYVNAKQPFVPMWMKKDTWVQKICQGPKNQLFAICTEGKDPKTQKVLIYVSADAGKSWGRLGFLPDGIQFDCVHISFINGRYYLFLTRYGSVDRGEIYKSKDAKKWELEKEFMFPGSVSTEFTQVVLSGDDIYIQGEADFRDLDSNRHNGGGAAFLLHVKVDSHGLSCRIVDSVVVRNGRVTAEAIVGGSFADFPTACESRTGLVVTPTRIIYPAIISGFDHERRAMNYQQTVLLRVLDRKKNTWSSHSFYEQGAMPRLKDIQIVEVNNTLQIFGACSWSRY